MWELSLNRGWVELYFARNYELCEFPGGQVADGNKVVDLRKCHRRFFLLLLQITMVYASFYRFMIAVSCMGGKLEVF